MSIDVLSLKFIYRKEFDLIKREDVYAMIDVSNYPLTRNQNF